jgi:hypothetical protein
VNGAQKVKHVCHQLLSSVPSFHGAGPLVERLVPQTTGMKGIINTSHVLQQRLPSLLNEVVVHCSQLLNINRRVGGIKARSAFRRVHAVPICFIL